MVRLCPVVPRRTSWCATKPARRTECSCTPPDDLAPRAPCIVSLVVGSAPSNPAPAALLASSIAAAVATAVPEGASTLCSWWSSTISMLSKNGAAIAARRIINTAEIAKFAASTAFGPSLLENAMLSSAIAVCERPVVPQTAWTSFAASHARLAAAARGTVKSIATSAEAAVTAPRSDSMTTGSTPSPKLNSTPEFIGSTAATSRRSGLEATAAATVRPILPPAPRTATRSGSANGIREVFRVEGPDYGEHPRSAEHICGDLGDVVSRNCHDLRCQLVDAEHVTVQQHRCPDPAHARSGVFEAQQRVGLDMTFRERELAITDPVLCELFELLGHETKHLVCVVRRRPDADRQRAGIFVDDAVGADRVTKPALLPDLLEESRGQSTAEAVIEQREREPLLGFAC